MTTSNPPTGTAGPPNPDARDDAVPAARDQVVSGLKSVGIDPEALADTARGKAGDLQEFIAAEVRRKPYHAMAIAAAVGFLFAMSR